MYKVRPAQLFHYTVKKKIINRPWEVAKSFPVDCTKHKDFFLNFTVTEEILASLSLTKLSTIKMT